MPLLAVAAKGPLSLLSIMHVRGLPLSTSAPRGGSKNRPILRTNSLTAVRTRGEGLQNPENFVDVLNGSPKACKPCRAVNPHRQDAPCGTHCDSRPSLPFLTLLLGYLENALNVRNAELLHQHGSLHGANILVIDFDDPKSHLSRSVGKTLYPRFDDGNR